MLGGTENSEYDGPRTPTLPENERSLDPREFTLAALKFLKIQLTEETNGLLRAEENGGREYIRFADPADPARRTTLYAPGAPAFERLVNRVVASGLHKVEDLDQDPTRASRETAQTWVSQFGDSSCPRKPQMPSECSMGQLSCVFELRWLTIATSDLWASTAESRSSE